MILQTIHLILYTSCFIPRYSRLHTLTNNDTSNITLELPDLSYDPSLFKPLNGVNPLCKKEFSTDRLLNDTIKRLRLVPPPETNLNQTLLSLEQLGGIGTSGPLTLLNPNSSFEPRPTKTKIKIQGVINIVKLFAQMMFYSRAGGVDPTFMTNATSKDVYRFVEWIDWSASVLRVDNVQSATGGMVMTDAILKSLENGCYNVKGSASRCRHDDGSSATFFVGHDSDLTNVGKFFQNENSLFFLIM